MVKYADKNVNFSHIRYGDFKTDINSSERPSTALSVNFASAEFANKTGNRPFISACPLKKRKFRFI